MKKPLIVALCLLPLSCTYAKSKKAEFDTATIEQIVGLKGQFDEKEKVLKFNAPRDDLDVSINQVKITPPFGLASWIAFKKVNDDTLVMGDLALTQDQVNSVMSDVLENGLQVTALHNHLLWESPRIMFMHIEGSGKADDLAKAVNSIFEKIKSTTANPQVLPNVTVNPEKTTIDIEKIDKIIGEKGSLTKGVYKIVIGRKAKIDDHKIGSLMGINSWAAFMGSENEAVVNGDLATHESEVQDVLKVLRNAGINVVSIHQHMLTEKPRYIYIHFYGIDKAESLAKAVGTALKIIKD